MLLPFYDVPDDEERDNEEDIYSAANSNRPLQERSDAAHEHARRRKARKQQRRREIKIASAKAEKSEEP